MSATASSTLGLTTPSQPVLPEIVFTLSEGSPFETEADIVIVTLFEEGLNESSEILDSAIKALDPAVQGFLSDLALEQDFTGKAGQSAIGRVLQSNGGSKVKRIGLVGLGSAASALTAGARVWKTVGDVIASSAKQAKASSVAIAVLGSPDLSPEQSKAIVSGITAGTILGTFEDTRFKTEWKPPSLSSVAILGVSKSAALEAEIGRAARVAAGVILTKQLVNAPPNVLTPAAMADVATAISFAHSDVISVSILEREDCEALGMGAYLGVTAASDLPPKFIHLKYTPSEGPVTKKLAIVGKGLTFDSGGYNIKAGAGSMIELMKFDMGGAAATLGAAKAIGAIQPPGVEVHFIVAACENMVSGTGMRPGDILTASNGRTIEVNNTDAEGRLTLADALVYASKLKVDGIVDLATLTGACIIALGNDIAGMFTPSDSIAAELSEASKAVGEKLWRMPIEDSYKDMLKSNIADTVNTGGRPGGSITAALFLKEFVDSDIPWAHLDIAGPVWSDKKGGGTGFGTATLVEWVQSYSTSSSS